MDKLIRNGLYISDEYSVFGGRTDSRIPMNITILIVLVKHPGFYYNLDIKRSILYHRTNRYISMTRIEMQDDFVGGVHSEREMRLLIK